MSDLNHTTDWFRTPRMWMSLLRLIRHHPGPLNIWSGAYSTGEEAYSAAILLDLAGNAGRVIATDLSPDVVEHGRAGLYTAAPSVENYVVDGQVAQRIRDRVTFEEADLRTVRPPACDIALVRNVWLYLAVHEQHRLAEAIARTLRPGGLLVLGGADTFPTVEAARRRRERIPIAITRYFRPLPSKSDPAGMLWTPERSASSKAPVHVRPRIDPTAPKGTPE
ncbi:CheR family methyltransferase [Microbacterium esteraromaticum]|uniref:CheR family methyltransferase n=1 Tax=Microbacterium esteraromaticum TaxID=57043 RepID=UPI001C951E50|nr:CheR family methyltransferase [Microbacterium esteraromaticum]MBY6061606.1 methyltransferase domain-containing protein [Microbacterium esteraromaticum]